MSFGGKCFLKKTSILKSLITLQIHDKNTVLIRRILFTFFMWILRNRTSEQCVKSFISYCHIAASDINGFIKKKVGTSDQESTLYTFQKFLWTISSLVLCTEYSSVVRAHTHGEFISIYFYVKEKKFTVKPL